MHISLDSALGQQRRLNSVGESITQIAPDPAAAYSLRSLTGGDPKVVRVRRASDNHEQDFTASDVSSGALQDFVNAQVVAPLDIQALSATGRDGDFLIAKAAYSLRSLGTRQATLAATGDTVARANGKYVCQVRRDSDDALKSFTATEVTDGTLLAFTNEDYAKYTSDFSAGDDGWGAFDDVTETGNIDGIGGLDNNLRLAIGSATSQHRAFKNGILPVNQKINFSARVFIPSTNSVVDSLGIRDASGSVIIASGTTPTQDQWVTVTASNVTTTNASGQLRVDLQDGGTNSFAGNGSDVIYLREITVTQVTSDGFVKTWYDQSVTTQAGDTATGNHATQATAANQPKIVDAGSLLADGIEFDGSNDRLVSSNGITVTTSSDISFSLVGESDDITATQTIVSQKSGTGQGRSWTDIVSSNFRTSIGGSAKTFGSVSSNGTPFIYSFILDESANTGDAFKDGSQSGSQQSISAAEAANGELVIGSNNGESGQFFNGHLEELIVYLSDQTDNRVAIEANMGEAYSIDLPSGVDPGFDQVDGFVETWYDQSGNGNNGTQTTASLQPKIVDAGSLITMNGKPAFEFTSSSSSPNFHLFNMTSEISGISDFSTFFVSEVVDRSGRGVLIGKDGQNYLRIRDVDFQLEASNTDSGAIAFNSVLTDGGQFSLAFIRASNTLTAYVAGAAQSNTVSISDNLAVNKLFGTANNNRTWINKAQELIFYTSDQTANVSTLNTNMTSHYEIS